jgi:O-acetyl-ADP-ribose deacetylase (regulator of RNase III)
LAEVKDYSTIAYPVLGSGSGGFSKIESIKIMQQTLDKIDSNLQVIIVDFKN